MKCIFILFISTVLLAGCSHPYIDSDNPCNTPIGAIPFIFSVSDNKNDDLFSKQYLGKFPLDSVKIYHKDSTGIHFDEFDLTKRTDVPTGQNSYMIDSPNDILDLSLKGTKTFYLKRNYNLTDTIVFDETNVKTSAGCNNFVLHKFTYNGVPLMDTKEGYFSIVLDRP